MVTSWGGFSYERDSLGMIKKLTGGGLNLRYAYTADDERILAFDVDAFQSVWRLRDLGGQVVREFRLNNLTNVWSWQKDWIRRGGQPLAAVDATEGTRHLHPDHLGTTRVITDSAGSLRSTYHVDLYGELAKAITPGQEDLLFTGHERDDHDATGGASGTTDDLDYMHARYYSPQVGRFFRVDPVNSQQVNRPLSWNKYSYVRSNPLIHHDPDGRALDTVLDIGFVAYDLFDIGRSLVRGEGVSGTQLAALGADVGAVFIPFATGAGPAVRALRATDGVVDSHRIASTFAKIEDRVDLLKKVIRSDGSLNTTETVARQMRGEVPGKDRSFIPVQSILDTIGSGAKFADPQGTSGFSIFKAAATFNGSRGILEVLVDENTGRIAHVLFKSGKKALE